MKKLLWIAGLVIVNYLLLVPFKLLEDWAFAYLLGVPVASAFILKSSINKFFPQANRRSVFKFWLVTYYIVVIGYIWYGLEHIQFGGF